MKKAILILVFLSAQLSSCQTIVPLTNLDIPNGTYAKDINNVLLPYIGTWEGTLNNKKYTFTFTKFIQRPVNFPTGNVHYEDDLKGKLKVIDMLTGAILYDNSSAIAYEDYEILWTFPNHGISIFYFCDKDIRCNNRLQFKLQNVAGQTNQLRYTNFEYTDSWKFWDCPGYTDRMDIPVFLPKVDLILTKI